MSYNCGNCGAEFEEGTKFCPNCGSRINWETEETEQSFTCGNCGGEFKGQVDFCPHCGTKIKWEAESTFMAKTLDYIRNHNYISWIFAILIGIIYYNVRTCDSSSSYSKYDSVDNTNGSNSIAEDGKEIAELQEQEDINPIAKFVGAYQLYDDYDNKQFSHFKVTEDGRFCKSIIKITLDEGRKNTSEYDVLGKIELVSNNVFSVHLTKNFFLDGVVDSDGDELRPWAYHGNTSHALLQKEFPIYSDLIFDISENKMYFDKEEYNNRDLKSPYYYTFKFTKN